MKKVIKLTESDLTRIVKRVINEQSIDKPTDEESLYHFLGRHTDLSDNERQYMARIFNDIQDGIDRGKVIRRFIKKYPDAVVPAHLILALL